MNKSSGMPDKSPVHPLQQAPPDESVTTKSCCVVVQSMPNADGWSVAVVIVFSVACMFHKTKFRRLPAVHDSCVIRLMLLLSSSLLLLSLTSLSVVESVCCRWGSTEIWGLGNPPQPVAGTAAVLRLSGVTTGTSPDMQSISMSLITPLSLSSPSLPSRLGSQSLSK